MTKARSSHSLHASILPKNFDVDGSEDLFIAAIAAEDQNSEEEFNQESPPSIKDKVKVELRQSVHTLLHQSDGIAPAENLFKLTDRPTSRSNTEEDDTWLRECCEKQEESYGMPDHGWDIMGTWELDLLHHQHECYNAFLFKTLRRSSIGDQNSPAKVLGYGRVELRVRFDKESTTYLTLTLDNVKYVQGAPHENNHRIGLDALPKSTNLHLPRLTTLGDQGDGFLSIDNMTGCALGRIDQGSRKIWALRTYDPENGIADTQATTKKGFFSGWFTGSSSGSRSAKRRREDDDTELREGMADDTLN